MMKTYHLLFIYSIKKDILCDVRANAKRTVGDLKVTETACFL